MSRLIDADALIDKTDDRYSLGEIGRRERDDIVNAVEFAPTIEERKTGKWIKFNNSCTIRCNQCGQEMTSLCDIQLPNYCLNCGARMLRGEEE